MSVKQLCELCCTLDIVGFKLCILRVKGKCLVLVLLMVQLTWHYMCYPYSLMEYKTVPTKFSSVRWGKNSNLHQQI